jgi:glycosyltransferase involved in cell wall biosynthesis
MPITIAIPFYNAEEYLLEAIQSVFAQTYKEWELILIDDGSTDGSLKIAKSINDPRVRVLSDGKNKRLAGRLNEVTKIAKYEYIARMDADDLMVANRLELQMKEFVENPNLDIVTTGVYSVLNNLELKGIRGSDFVNPSFDDVITKKVGITHAALIARKSWYQRNEYDESLKIAQDLDLWIRSSKKNDLKIKSIALPLYIYREENNVTYQKLVRAYNNERDMIKKYAEKGKFMLYFKSYIKTIVVKIIAFFDKIDKLQERRSKEKLSKKNIRGYLNEIKQLKEVKVPRVDI